MESYGSFLSQPEPQASGFPKVKGELSSLMTELQVGRPAMWLLICSCHALGKAVCISPPIHWMFERLDMKSRGRTDFIWFQCQKLEIMGDSLHYDNLATFSGISLAIHYIVFWHVITALAATVKQRMPRQWIQSYWAAWQKLHFWLCTPRRCFPFGWGLATALMMLLVNQAVLVTVECAAACGDVGAG